MNKETYLGGKKRETKTGDGEEKRLLFSTVVQMV